MISFKKNSMADNFKHCAAYYHRIANGYNPYSKEMCEEIRLFQSVAQLTKDMRILEVGSSFGHYTIPLLDAGYKIDCLDFSEEMFEIFDYNINRFKSPSPNRKIVADIWDFNGEYDAVIGFNVLHHLIQKKGDIRLLFDKFRVLLGKGGKIAFREPRYAVATMLWTIASFSMDWRNEKGQKFMKEKLLREGLMYCGYKDLVFYDDRQVFPGIYFSAIR